MSSALAGLGRVRSWDPKNLDYKLPRKALPPGVRTRYWNSGGVLDQGNTPQCVGYAGWGWLAGGPVINHPPFTPTELYYWAQDRDEWPGRNYEGTSTLGLMKALKDRGYINEYRWAPDADTLVRWYLSTGPVLCGTDWYIDMCDIDRDGFIHPTGENVGGHEWRVIGGNLDKKCPDGSTGASRIVNSWGDNWADHGRAWISNKDLDFLIKNNGEAVTAMEIRLR